jgi:hypothetical protein
MKFTRIDDALARCEIHLDSTGARNSELETYLVSYLLVLISAEYEMCYEKLLELRAVRFGDHHVSSVIKRWAHSQKSRMKISDIAGCLGAFGQDYKNAFDAKVNDPASKAVLAWNNIYTNRNSVAHEEGTSVTLNDLKVFFADSKPIMLGVAEAMAFTPAEIAALTWP